MPKTTLALALIAISLIFAPALANAEDSAQPSYSLKKQGRVPFASSEASANEQQDASEASPQAIEPAAGAEEATSEETTSQRSALQEQMKLPRKN